MIRESMTDIRQIPRSFGGQDHSFGQLGQCKVPS
jgi:hypothetical protein